MNRLRQQWVGRNKALRVRQQMAGSGEPIPKPAHHSDDHLSGSAGMGPIVVTFDEGSGGPMGDGIGFNSVPG